MSTTPSNPVQICQPNTETPRPPERCPWCGAIEPTSCEVCEEAIGIMKSALKSESQP